MYQLVRGAWKVPGASPELRRLTVKGSEVLTRQCHNAVTLTMLVALQDRLQALLMLSSIAEGSQAEDTAPRAND